MRTLAGLAVLIAIAGCGSSIKSMEDGSLRVQCDTVLSTCMRRAEAHCRKEGGVHVLSAREINELYGVEGNQTGTLASEVRFVCNADAPRTPIKLPPRPVASAALASSAAPSTPPAAAGPAKRVCIPGSTQKCVGPGACVGGQACLPDGTAFSACDCGPVDGTAADAGTDGSTSALEAGAEPAPAPVPAAKP